MIPTKTIVDKANTKITAGGLTDLEYTQLSGIEVALTNSIPKTVASVALLPTAGNYTGVMYYVSGEQQYYFSDGTNWRNDFTSDNETQNIITYAWGSNAYGKLGDNTTTSRSSPVTVVGGLTNWSQVSAGGKHSLGITVTGIAYAWGYNAFGQLGDNTATSRLSPVTVVGGITTWSQVSAGGPGHSLGVTSTGIAYAWGQGTSGKLGDNTGVSRSSPVTVVGGITTWRQLAANDSHSLGITSAGIAYAWGNGTSGRLGDNAASNRESPVTVVGGITTWSQIAAGYNHSLGVTSTGIAYAWGYASGGRLGDNTTTSRSSPVTVVGGITTWSQVSAGQRHSLGVTSTGIAYGWGYGTSGVIGDDSATNRSSPVTVVGGITNWRQVSAGGISNEAHSLGITSAGIAYAWGHAGSGRLGDNTVTSRSSPVTIAGGLTNWSQVSAGTLHSLGINAVIKYTKGFAI